MQFLIERRETSEGWHYQVTHPNDSKLSQTITECFESRSWMRDFRHALVSGFSGMFEAQQI